MCLLGHPNWGARVAWSVSLLLLAGCNPERAHAPSGEPPDQGAYYRVLDDWVARGGPVDEVQGTVVATCGKLVLQTATLTEQPTLLTTRRADFDFRVDVCVKMTVHRVHPQPEFDKAEAARILCDESEVGLFKALCGRAGLR